jgi:hypothetical protein
MEHPFINNLQDLSLEDLQEKIGDLTKKLNFAYRMQNGPMIHQINMALESYKSEYSKKMDNLIKKQNINSQIKVEKK